MAVTDEIVVGPLEVYLAAVATAFPNVDTAPPGAWTLLGTNGDKNIDEDGVTVAHEQEVETFTPVGMTVPFKAFRTSEGWRLGFNLVDLSATQFAKVMDDATVTATAASTGVPGTSSFPLLRGTAVQLFALLARGTGISPAGPTFGLQFEATKVFQSGSPEPVFSKGAPAMLGVEFTALGDENDNFVDLVIQTAVAG